MNSHEVFIHIHQGCFAGTGAIVRLPQCQWSKPDGYGKISQSITTTKHSKAKTVCIFLGIYCSPASVNPNRSPALWEGTALLIYSFKIYILKNNKKEQNCSVHTFTSFHVWIRTDVIWIKLSISVYHVHFLRDTGIIKAWNIYTCLEMQPFIDTIDPSRKSRE